MNILVSDSLSPKGVEVLERAGFSVAVKTKLTKDELLKEIPQYEGLIVRSATKVTKDVIESCERIYHYENEKYLSLYNILFNVGIIIFMQEIQQTMIEIYQKNISYFKLNHPDIFETLAHSSENYWSGTR